MGGQGVVSVLSNVLPAQTVELCDRYFAGDVAGAAAMQRKYVPLIKALFSEVNPIPVKAAMDALPVAEQTGTACASEIPGVIHACGHAVECPFDDRWISQCGKDLFW